MIKILLLSANPKDTENLRVAEEFREIKEAIEQATYRDSFKIYQGEAVRPKDLRRLIIKKSPHIIHFSGHGEKEGIYLENESGYSQPVEGEDLQELFSLSHSVHSIILNSCYSENQAKHLKNIFSYIIGTSNKIIDQDAINFSIGFYDALGDNRSLEDAFEYGLNSINLEKENINTEKTRSFDLESFQENAAVPMLIKGENNSILPNINVKKESEKESLYVNFVKPALNDFNNLHNNYLESFYSYLDILESQGEDDLTTNNILIKKIKKDITFSNQYLVKLDVLSDSRDDPIIGKFIRSIFRYKEGSHFIRNSILRGQPRTINAARHRSIKGLEDIFRRKDSSEFSKKKEAYDVLNNLVVELQNLSQAILYEYQQLKSHLLNDEPLRNNIFIAKWKGISLKITPDHEANTIGKIKYREKAFLLDGDLNSSKWLYVEVKKGNHILKGWIQNSPRNISHFKI